MNTLILDEAAGFLKMHPEEVRCRAKRGLIPASKPGRRWVFIDDDLAAFLRGKYPTQRQALRVTSEKGSAPWVSANGMRWKQIDLERRMAWVHPDQAKARRAIPVPLNREAIAVLQMQLGKHRDRVFTFRGNPVAAITTKAWYSAVKRAGVAPLRFHDLRHTFASWHVQQGTPLSVLQELGGWQSSAMVSRYAHLGAEHLAPWNDRLAKRGTNSARSPATTPDETSGE